MATKYEPLENYLKNKLGQSRVDLTFKEIEEIIGAPLPTSALQHREWWSNQKDVANRPQAKSWLSAGFKVGDLHQSLKSGRVSFVRK